MDITFKRLDVRTGNNYCKRKEECVWYSKLWRSSDDIIFQKRTEILGPEDLRDEIEKDVWELKNLDIKSDQSIYNVKHWISENISARYQGRM